MIKEQKTTTPKQIISPTNLNKINPDYSWKTLFMKLFIKRKKLSIRKFLSIFFCIFFFIGPDLCAYAVSTTRTDRVNEFNDFLAKCSARERIILLQTLRALDEEVEDALFGKVKGLKALGNYTKSPEWAKKNRHRGVLLRPKTFNDVSPDTVLDALEKGFIKLDYSQDAIKEELIWRRYHKAISVCYNKKEINYHYDILRWIAEKKKVDPRLVKNHSSFDLERAVAHKYLEEIWNKLTPEQRHELLVKIEKETKSSIGNKIAIAAMSGGAAIAALGTTVALSGFAFYTTMSVVISTVAGWFGITLPFAAYMGASGSVAILSGPIGWAIAGVAIASGIVILGLPEEDTIAAFVIQVNQIKTSWISK